MKSVSSRILVTYTAGGFFWGLLITIAAYLIEIFSNNYQINFNIFYEIHSENITIWLTDIIPFTLALIGYFTAKQIIINNKNSLSLFSTEKERTKNVLDYIENLRTASGKYKDIKSSFYTEDEIWRRS